MFDVRAVVLEVEAEENSKSEDTPRAKAANCAINATKVSTFSTFSTPRPSGNADCHAKRVALEWLELIQETNPVNIEHVINVAITRPESLKFMERRIDQLSSPGD